MADISTKQSWLTHNLKWLTIWIALNLIDLGMTFMYLARGGAEANPLLHYLLAISPMAMIIYKIGGTLAVIAVLQWIAKDLGYLKWFSLLIGLLVIWNIIIFMRF